MIFAQARESNEKRTSEKFRPQEKKKKCFGLALGEGLETGSLHSALCCLCTFRELSSPLVSY